MANFPKKYTTYFLIVLALFYYSTILTSCNDELVASFVFGDSLVDVGNNNYLVTLSKANYPPNGIDFGTPTGRYTNGRTIADIIGQELGLNEYSPPYLAPTTFGMAVMKGVNYASGGGGILNQTGRLFYGRLNFDAQLDNFANTKQDLIRSIGENATKTLLEKALFSVTMGSNDFINNYLTPVVSRVEQYLVSPEAFVDSMIFKYRLQLMRLRKMGAKKILVANVGPIGCIPYIREVNPSSGTNCVPLANHLAQLFNSQLKSLLSELTHNLPGSIFVYADVSRVFNNLLTNYKSYGFDDANTACCYVSGRYGGLIPCGPYSSICEDRSKYVFWDPYHPSDAANVVIARRLIDGKSDVISPLNVRQLIRS